MQLTSLAPTHTTKNDSNISRYAWQWCSFLCHKIIDYLMFFLGGIPKRLLKVYCFCIKIKLKWNTRNIIIKRNMWHILFQELDGFIHWGNFILKLWYFKCNKETQNCLLIFIYLSEVCLHGCVYEYYAYLFKKS